jgi:xylulokinase
MVMKAKQPFLVGIDIGTSGAKAVVMDLSGGLLAWAGQEYAIQTPRAGWAEQNPEDWVAAAAACVTKAVAQAVVDPREAAGIGLAGQMHSLVCLGQTGEPLRPAILWADQRSAAQVRRLTAQLGVDRLAEWTGNPLAAGFMLASWAWLVENEPRIAQAARWLMLPKDYVRFRLTGEIGTEPSDASSTLLFDPHAREWSAPLLEVVGLSAERLPPVSPSAAVAGGLLPRLAGVFGLLPGTPVIFGGSDVSLQALAQGVTQPGTVSCTIGTGGQLFAPIDAPSHDPQLRLHLFCHCLEQVWHHEAAILSAGLALRWLRDQLWPAASYGALADGADSVQASADGLFFLPFLSGERTPYMDPALRAGFIGLSLRHGQSHLVRAAMEGVVFALRQGLDLMQSLGTPVDRLVASGGAAQHPLWLQLLADIFNCQVYVSSSKESGADKARGADTARGAAILAGVGAGVYADGHAAVQAAVSQPVLGAGPDPTRAGLYQAGYESYCGWAGTVAGRYRNEAPE